MVDHVKKLHPESVKLGNLHEVDTGFIEQIGSTCLGITRVLDTWWFASIFLQYGDADEVAIVEMGQLANLEENIFGQASPMSLIIFVEKEQGDRPSGQMGSFLIDDIGNSLSYSGRPIKRVMITAEKQRRIWDPKTHFFAYEEVFPNRLQRGIAIISDFKVDEARGGRLTLVISPDPDNVTGREAHIAGQFEFL